MSHLSRQSTPHFTLATLLVVVLATLLGGSTCQTGPPEAVDLKTTIDYLIEPHGAGQPNGGGGGKQDEPSLRQQLVDDLDQADRRIWAAVAGEMMDQEIAQALVAAHDDGVDVQLVADVDNKSEPDFQMLKNAGIPITWGDGALSYLPGPYLGQILTHCTRHEPSHQIRCRQATPRETPTRPCNDPTVAPDQGTMCRPGDFNVMSHRFFIVDDTTVWNLAAGFGDESTGDLGWRADSEYLRQDFVREFRQLAGGTFATELDEYNGGLKSRTNSQIDYLTDKGVMQVRFNPQERLMKHVVDAAYATKESIQIVTPSLTNPFLLDALEFKHEHDFDVQIVVGADTQPEGNAKQRLQQLGAQAHPNGQKLPTAIVIDDGPADQGRNQPTKAMVLSHPLWHASPFGTLQPEDPGAPYASDRVRIYRSDYFVDGNMWLLREFANQPGGSEQIDRLAEFVNTALDRSSDL